jgi:hypothetical protein
VNLAKIQDSYTTSLDTIKAGPMWPAKHAIESLESADLYWAKHRIDSRRLNLPSIS